MQKLNLALEDLQNLNKTLYGEIHQQTLLIEAHKGALRINPMVLHSDEKTESGYSPNLMRDSQR